MRKWMAGMLVAAMCVTLFAEVGEADAKTVKPKLSKKKLELTAGSSKSLKVTKAKGAKITWKSSSKKTLTVKKSGKYTCKVTGKKKGKAVITCKVKGKKTYSLKCNVNIKAKKNITDTKTAAPSAAPSTVPSVAPSASPTAPAANTSVPSASAEAPGTQTTTPASSTPAEDDSIRKAYEGIFPYMGSCVNYNAGMQLQDEQTLSFVKKHFNSITLENEMKPEAILGGEVDPLTKEEALALGYVVPDNYTEEVIPRLEFETVDQVLKIAHDNGLKVRAHTLVWHSQTPGWFFTKEYANKKDTTPEIMDARLEFYVRSVMKHVMEKEKELTGEAGSIVYAWDVVNEYLHRMSWGHIWDSVYGNKGMKPSYVKKAFQLAYDMVKQYGVQDKVTLFYNDYDTYFNIDDVVELVNFINAGEDAKICNGIGMQSHVDITRPTLDQYEAALDRFMATGLEVQITELDITINYDHENETWQYKNKNETDEDQAAFVKDFMRLVVRKQKERDVKISPKGITGVTIWGLYDTISWRAQCSPLLFKDSIDSPKPSFQEFLNAAKG